MIQLNPVYVLFVMMLVFLIKIIDCGQLIFKQRVSFNPVLNAFYYIFGIFGVLTIFTMFNERGLIYHRLMSVILLVLAGIILIPSVFVKPTVNSLIATAAGTIMSVSLAILTFFLIGNPQNGTFFGLGVHVFVQVLFGTAFYGWLRKVNEKGNEELFYKRKLWELLNNRLLLVPVFALICIEFALQYLFGFTLLFFLPF